MQCPNKNIVSLRRRQQRKTHERRDIKLERAAAINQQILVQCGLQLVCLNMLPVAHIKPKDHVIVDALQWLLKTFPVKAYPQSLVTRKVCRPSLHNGRKICFTTQSANRVSDIN